MLKLTKGHIKNLIAMFLMCTLLLASNAGTAMAATDGGYVTTIAAGAGRGFAIKSDGTLWAWGAGHMKVEVDGKDTYLGTGDTADRLTPVKIMDNVVSIDSATTQTVALKSDGSAWTWGNNKYGQLGTGDKENRLAPVKVMDSVIAVHTLGAYIWFVKNDFTLWASGWDYGDRPVKLMEDVAYVDGTSVIKTDGTLWNWGNNEYGLVGDGTTTYCETPKKILDGVAMVSHGGGRAMAVKTDGSLWFWGRQDAIDTIIASVSPPLDSSYKEQTPPAMPGAPEPITTISPNLVLSPIKIMDGVAKVYIESTIFIVKTDGTLLAWGDSAGAGLGPADEIDEKYRDKYYLGAINTPLKVADNIVDVHKVSANAVALKADGTLWTWGGWNENGSLGTGTQEFFSRPVKIMDGIMLPTAAPAPPPPPNAMPTSSTVYVNSRPVAFDAYLINGNNYFKLRDLAYTLNGTNKQFETEWDGVSNTIMLVSGRKYTPVGGEMTPKGTGNMNAMPTTSKITLDGKEVKFTAYNIGGNNYFKLRDVAAAFDFGVFWDGANNAITIDTNTGYTPE
ncbi:MAG: hypothetical protein LBK23_03705 [Oscillospiraceae bacterium]|jgi:alpha-tubulin suppressor-like RCC1 family protein|nr:hypothetical protein [Oscillospiraceae bacterium]